MNKEAPDNLHNEILGQLQYEGTTLRRSLTSSSSFEIVFSQLKHRKPQLRVCTRSRHVFKALQNAKLIQKNKEKW